MLTKHRNRKVQRISRLRGVEALETRRLLSSTFYVSPKGNDANTGTDIQDAWQHIQQAMNAATPGSTVLVEPGIYNEKVTVNVSGDATDGFITFQAVGRVTITGRGLPAGNIITITGQNYVQIIGFNIQDNVNAYDASGIRITGADNNIQILNNTIHHITGTRAMGITVYGTDAVNGISNLVVSGNQIYDCQPALGETLTLAGNVYDFTVTNNYVHDVNNIGIDFIGGEGFSSNPATDIVRDGEVSGNRITRAHFVGTGRDAAGIFVDGGQNIVVERNTAWNDDVGIEVNAVQPGAVCINVIVRDNYVFDNRESGISIGASQQTDGTEEDCQVTNNTLYHDNTEHDGDGEIRLQYGSDNLIENNLVVGLRGTQLFDGTFGSANNTSDYNLFYSPDGPNNSHYEWNDFPYTGLSLFENASGQDVNSIFANPLLVSPGSFIPRISRRSPAINAGDPTYTPGAGETDFNGQPRLLGSAVDIGAVEVG